MLPSQNRSYLAYHWAGVLVMLICSLCIACFAQSTTSTSPATGTSDNDTDPTRPVFMSIRQEYYDFIGDYWGMATVYRTDKAVLKNRRLGGKSGILLRTDIPLVQVSSGATTEVGIGDIYAQALFIPHIRKTFALATGVGLLTPTATDKALGGGKWKLAPLVLPVWFFGPKAFALVKLQDTFSFAGQSSRPEVHFFR